MPREILHSSALLLFAEAGLAQAREFCFGVNNEQYRCEMGYCCGETECCTYYYELWWFWLVWTLILLMSCCCAFRHRRVKQRLQQQQRQREISLLAYQGASAGIRTPPTSMGFWTDCKLPDYEEVIAHPPTPPPPYTETHAPTDPGAPSEVQSEPAEEDLDSGGRRRRVTGDSGIEVCVCVSVCPLHEEDHECGGAECCPETQSSV